MQKCGGRVGCVGAEKMLGLKARSGEFVKMELYFRLIVGMINRLTEIWKDFLGTPHLHHNTSF